MPIRVVSMLCLFSVYFFKTVIIDIAIYFEYFMCLIYCDQFTYLILIFEIVHC